MKAFFRALCRLLTGRVAFERRVALRAMELAHEAGMKDALPLHDTLHVAEAYFVFATTGFNPLDPPATPEDEA